MNFGVEYNPKLGTDPIEFTGVFVLLSSVCLFLFFSMTTPTFFVSTRLEVVEYKGLGNTETVDETHGYATNVLLYLSIVLQSFSSLFIIFSLDKTIAKLSRFDTLERYRKRVKFKNRFLSCICVSVLILITILAATEYLPYAAVVAVVVQLITATYFIWSAYNFVKTIKRLSASENVIVQLTTDLVRKTCIWSSIALIILPIAIIIFATTVGDHLSTLRPGGFNHVLFIRDIALFSGLFLLTVTAWYVNSVTEGAIFAEECGGCCSIFKVWDKKNLELMPGDVDILRAKSVSIRQDTRALVI